ncbi:MAG: ABC transporter ATP-binding protein/permease, partial [Gammaproteobacteria bacterium]|nr:ABC transporter ATP-binding protein/permease [Gammaproteobacteria bacterium]
MSFHHATESANTTAETPIAITITELTKEFVSGKSINPALKHLTVSIRRGSITGLVGPDGAGKTTLMRMITGLLTPTQGTITVEGFDTIQGRQQIHKLLGYMPQKFGLYDDLTVMENLNLYAELRCITPTEKANTIPKLLAFTELTSFTSRMASNLSGGMKQKLGLACTLLGHPRILLLDEPSVGVDPISRRELWKIVHALVADGITVVWSTAYLDEAELCDEVILLNAGEVLYTGAPVALIDKLQDRTVQLQDIMGNHRQVLQHALRNVNVSDGVIQGQNVRLLLRKANQFPDFTKLNAGPQIKLVPVKPRFEDAYIDILGGGPGGDSVLSQVMKPLVLPTNIDMAIVAEGLTKKFGDFTAANQISFSVKPGEIFGLLGPNGAGKSTIFKMLCGLLKPTTGTTRIFGIDLHASISTTRQKIGYMAQKFSLYNDLSVIQNLAFFSGIYGLSGRRQQEKIQEMITTFSLTPYLNMRTGDIPLGFKQRLALACSIMHQPLILFLDEPTSGVDPFTRREFWTHINGLVEKGMTVVVTTHFMDEAEYCDQIALIYQANVVATGTPDDVKQLAITPTQPDPTMDDTFITLITAKNKASSTKTDSNQNYSARQTNLIPQRWYPDAPYLRRWYALAKKESLQIIRDPSSILIAFILPLLMLLIFGFGVNLDSAQLRLGVLLNDHSPEAQHLALSLKDSPYIKTIPMADYTQATRALTSGQVRGLFMILPNFSQQLLRPDGDATVAVITDGSETNTANFAAGYAIGAFNIWQTMRGLENGLPYSVPINLKIRYWYNPEAISRYFIVPGSIALIMTVIGALLTSLVVAREWEQGTMEALLSTPMTRAEFFFSKLIPYYVLGMMAMIVCWLTGITLLGMPFRGSALLLILETTLFLGSALGIGLLLSTVIRNQFNAAQAALNIAFLPAVMLSGFVYEINSMPPFVRGITYVVPARYFVSALQTLFLTGNV